MDIFNVFKSKPDPWGQLPGPKGGAQTPRFAVNPDAMFNLGATRALHLLFQSKVRDAAWLNSFYLAAWNASVSVGEPEHFDGPDGMPYYRLNLPAAGTDFDAQSLSNLAGMCVERNAGAAFFAHADDPETAPQFVLSMGVLDSMLRYDSPDGDPVDCEVDLRSQILFAGSRQILTASPSADFLPGYTARALHRYMSRIWGIYDPRVHLLVDPALHPSRNLVIGRKRSSFSSSAEVADEMARLAWFMPPHRSLMLMPEDWSLGDMDCLIELGTRPANRSKQL